jgi:hypothetical protein
MPIRCKLKETRPPVQHKKEDRINRETDTRVRVATYANKKTAVSICMHSQNRGWELRINLNRKPNVQESKKSVCVCFLADSIASYFPVISSDWVCVCVLCLNNFQQGNECARKSTVIITGCLAILRRQRCGIPLGWRDISSPRQHLQQNRRPYCLQRFL